MHPYRHGEWCNPSSAERNSPNRRLTEVSPSHLRTLQQQFIPLAKLANMSATDRFTTSAPAGSACARRKRRGLPLVLTAAVVLLITGCTGSPDSDAYSASPNAAASNSTSPASGQEPATTPPPSSSTAIPSATATAETGVLVEGFPTELIPVMDKSEVLASDVETTGDVAAVSLIGSTDAPAKKVLNYYDGVFTDQDFNSLEDSSIEGTASQTYARAGGTETVTISAVNDEDGTTYTIGAHVLPESIEQKP